MRGARNRRPSSTAQPPVESPPAPAEPSPALAAASGAPSTSSQLLDTLKSVGPPVTVATALLLYFGWARADAQAKTMGIDVSVFAYTAQDYVLRSVTALFTPIVVVLLVMLGWVVIDRSLRRQVPQFPQRIRWVCRAIAIVGGVGLAASSVLLLGDSDFQDIVGPYLAAISVMVTSWGFRLLRAVRERDEDARSRPWRAEQVIVFVLVTLFLFWGTADFAQAVGRTLAYEYSAQIATLPSVSVYSPNRLLPFVAPVQETQLQTESGPTYKYTGLRLLVLSGQRYFFLHDGWTVEDGRVLVLKDSDSLTFEFTN